MATECTGGVGQAMADSQIFNQKVLQDISALALFHSIFQSIVDNQMVARQRHVNAAINDNLAQLNVIAAAQTGVTENQQPTSPIRTAAADSTVQQPAGAAYPPIRDVDQASAQANSGIQAAMQAIADAMANLQAAMTTVLTTAAGGASTPSQTKPAT